MKTLLLLGRRCSRRSRLIASCAVLVVSALAQNAPTPTPDKDKKEEEELVVLSPFSLGVTPGGFKDVSYARDLLKVGLLPLPEEFTAEGLFSEYDLPLPEVGASTKLLRISGAGRSASILAQPEATHLVQIGFSSALTPETFKRDPLFLVLVLDVSGSMEHNLPLLKKSVQTILAKLREGDAAAIVTFSEDVQTVTPPVLVGRPGWENVVRQVDQIAIRGGTNIELGLQAGFALEGQLPAGFVGRRRVVLITDAMPNIGETGPETFMSLATNASLAGVGLTTIGLGLEFDAAFVRKVSSVSGGNAYWFADGEQMQKTLQSDFDFMVTEVAFDLKLQVKPAQGLRIFKVYGVPGDVYVIAPDGSLVMDVPTLFLSRNKGGIFISLAGAPTAKNDRPTLGRVDLSYVLYGKHDAETDAFEIRVLGEGETSAGLDRGELLVNEFEALTAAGQAFYHDNHLRPAHQMVDTLRQKFDRSTDRELKAEAQLLEKISTFLTAAELEPQIEPDLYLSSTEVPPLVGVWQAQSEHRASERWIFLQGGKGAVVFADDKKVRLRELEWSAKGIGKDDQKEFEFGVDAEGLFLTGDDQKLRLTRLADK
ncbi:MAG TPA: VWA domain-containing protein [Opitutaceae bacterium]